ncbi:hypothetical protein [Metabacillus idriensis]|uniref:hypothetical protein n=1 Tax=Metabacillus idriensis TaxID=324768 RepID=UPI00174AA7C5|nr:hypothetical protein [Metabacillus idriensis]
MTNNKEMRNRPFSSGMADKNPAEKSGFDFFDGFVLAEELGVGAGHPQKTVSRV